jgi:hypothetical protein
LSANGVLKMSLDDPGSGSVSPARVSSHHDPAEGPELIALRLREISEHAFRAGLGLSSSLIEVAALTVEMEGISGNQPTD